MVFVTQSLPDSGPAFDPAAWLADLREAYDAPALAVIGRALELAAHEAGFTQALGVANVLVGLRMDYQTVAAALAAPMPLEKTEQRAALAAQLGAEVLRLVDGVKRMDLLQRAGIDLTLDEGKKEPFNQAETLRKMLLAMAEDVRVVLLLLAEQVQLLRGLVKAEDSPLRTRAAQEAQEIFAPLANRLGIWQIKWELEDLALRMREPALYKKMARLLDERRVDRESYLDEVTEQLRAELVRAGVRGEVSGRPKHIYSIWRKMQLKHLDFDQVYDVRAVRVLVRDVKDCYGVLGMVHGLWQPIPGEFDDYISHPKPNDYRSLHTAVIGPEGRALEVQIRTFDMHQHAEFGVAAHWRYKEGAKVSQGFDEKIAWLRQLLAWKDEVAEAGGHESEWVEQFKTELFQDRVYVLTPQGKVIDLPQGATPLDFAYAVHTDLGHRCRGAKVDGSIVPLTYKLANAQRIEILTAKQGAPSRDWLTPGYLATARARAKIRQWFNQQNFDVDLAQGRDILERELHRLGVTGFNHDKLLQKFHYPRLEEFLAALGRGEVTPNQTALAIQDLAELKPKEVIPVSPPKRAPSGKAQAGAVIVEGVGSLSVGYGKCCKPVPPDPIVGYVTRGRGVVVHRQDCGNVTRLNEEQRPRLLQTSWNSGAGGVHAVVILVKAHDRQGLLRDISSVLSVEKVNVIGVQSESDSGVADMRFTLEVRDLTQMNRVLAEVKKVGSVKLARRVG